VPAGVIRAAFHLVQQGAAVSSLVIRGPTGSASRATTPFTTATTETAAVGLETAAAAAGRAGGTRLRRRDVLRRAVGRGAQKLVQWAERGEQSG
jgi:hypothetical protein